MGLMTEMDACLQKLAHRKLWQRHAVQLLLRLDRRARIVIGEFTNTGRTSGYVGKKLPHPMAKRARVDWLRASRGSHPAMQEAILAILRLALGK
jgi:hypothetical protein